MGTAYTWIGADGGSWNADSNWDDGSGHSTGYPGDEDLAQFLNFSGKVTGAVGSNVLYVGPGSALTLGGSGYFSQATVGLDGAGNVGAASLTVGSGNVVSATMLNLGSPLGGSGTLIAKGEFSTTGGIVVNQAAGANGIIVADGGIVHDGVSLAMANGGLIQIGASGQMVIGSSTAGGTNGALAILNGYSFNGEGTIAGNVIVDGTLATENLGWPANTLSVTGNLTGSGVVNVVQELDVHGAIGSGVTISLFSDQASNKGFLRLAQPTEDHGTLATMSTGSVIALDGLSFDHVSWSPDSLTVTGASGTLALATTGDHSFQSFYVKPDAISGTDIVVGVVPEPATAPMLLAGLLVTMLRSALRRRREQTLRRGSTAPTG